MVPPRTLAVLALALVTLSFVGASQPAAGAPPPRPLCDACGETFAETATDHGVSLTVADSTATITVHENGTAIWTVENRLDGTEPAQRLRTNESLRTEIAERAMWDTELLAANVTTDGVVTLRYRDPGFADPSFGGTLRSGSFTEPYGYGNLAGLGADRLTVVAPDGMRVGWAAPGASIPGDRGRMTLTTLDTGFVTFVPEDDPIAPLWSHLSVLALVGPAVALNAVVSIGIPTSVFGLLFGVCCGALSWLDPDLGPVADRVSAGLAVLGAITAAASLLVTTGSILGTSNGPVLGAGVGSMALGAVLSTRAGRTVNSYRALLGLAASGLTVGAVTVAASTSVSQYSGPLGSQIAALWFLVPIFAYLPAGYALARGRHRLAVTTAIVGFAVGLLPLFRPLGITVLTAALATLYAAAVTVGGLPLLLVGHAVAEEKR
jgi:hypothetical protein